MLRTETRIGNFAAYLKRRFIRVGRSIKLFAESRDSSIRSLRSRSWAEAQDYQTVPPNRPAQPSRASVGMTEVAMNPRLAQKPREPGAQAWKVKDKPRQGLSFRSLRSRLRAEALSYHAASLGMTISGVNWQLTEWQGFLEMAQNPRLARKRQMEKVRNDRAKRARSSVESLHA